jgi:hypothetical protein
MAYFIMYLYNRSSLSVCPTFFLHNGASYTRDVSLEDTLPCRFVNFAATCQLTSPLLPPHRDSDNNGTMTTVSPGNFCWPSPAQSFLISDPVGTCDQILVRSKTVYMFGNGVSSSTRGEVSFSEYAPHLLHGNSARVYRHSCSVQARAFVLY